VLGARAETGPAGPRSSARERLAALRSVWQVVLLFALVLGGMYLGWFSPTEAAAVGAVGAVTLAALSGRLDRATLLSGVSETALTTGMIFMILIGAGIFNAFIESTRLTDGVIGLIELLSWNRWTVFAAIMALYLVLGALMDELSMILLTVGPVFQLIVALGFDPIWFGVVLIIVCEIGMILPPVGINLFVIQGVAGVSQATVVRGIAPFAVVDGVRLLLLCAFPWLATWLPSHMI
jgi:tripartite ATP-independent transporter DctM subunit